MSVMRALEEAEYVYTRDGKKRVTHEAYSYLITPFAYPPIKVMVYKGLIDHRGTFQAIDAPKDIVLTQEEFKELLSPNSQGKPAGDFRLSDVLRCLKRRTLPKKAPGESAANAPAPEAAAEAPGEAKKAQGKDEAVVPLGAGEGG